MIKKLVRVILPAYKMGQFIGEAWEPVGGQTYPFWEGSLYTFDARKTIDFTESSKLIGECDFCTAPTKNFVNCANDFCHNQYLICGNCLNDPGNLECTHSDAKSSNKMKG